MKRIELNELQGVKMKNPELKFLLGGYGGGYGGEGCFACFCHNGQSGISVCDVSNLFDTIGRVCGGGGADCHPY